MANYKALNTIRVLTFSKTDAPAAEVFMGVLNRACPWLATWVAIADISPAPQKVCIDYLCQTYRPIGLFSVGLSVGL